MRDVKNARLCGFLASPGRFGVYGTGRAGASVIEALAGVGLKPQAFLDADRTGRLGDLEILAPEQALDWGLETVVTAGASARDMTAQLRADGFEGTVLDLSDAHRPARAGHFDEGLLDEASQAIAFARSLLHDERSRQIFDALLAHRRSLDPGDLPPPMPHYGHPALPVRDGEWVFDVGAGRGRSTLALAEAVGPRGRVHAFEPRADCAEALRAAVETSAVGARITVHACGCGRRRAAGDGDGGPVETLDDLVWEHGHGRVDRIRLDVGAAGAALEGAQATLERHRPRLAVCVAHGARDLWELPTRLKERVPGYRLHLGHHSQGLRETFCYARFGGA